MNADSHAYNTCSPESTAASLKLYINLQLKPPTSSASASVFRPWQPTPPNSTISACLLSNLNLLVPTDSIKLYLQLPASIWYWATPAAPSVSCYLALPTASDRQMFLPQLKLSSISTQLKHQFSTSTPSSTCHGQPYSTITAFVNKQLHSVATCVAHPFTCFFQFKLQPPPKVSENQSPASHSQLLPTAWSNHLLLSLPPTLPEHISRQSWPCPLPVASQSHLQVVQGWVQGSAYSLCVWGLALVSPNQSPLLPLHNAFKSLPLCQQFVLRATSSCRQPATSPASSYSCQHQPQLKPAAFASYLKTKCLPGASGNHLQLQPHLQPLVARIHHSLSMSLLYQHPPGTTTCKMTFTNSLIKKCIFTAQLNRVQPICCFTNVLMFVVFNPFFSRTALPASIYSFWLRAPVPTSVNSFVLCQDRSILHLMKVLCFCFKHI